jgi:hypothetical protein
MDPALVEELFLKYLAPVSVGVTIQDDPTISIDLSRYSDLKPYSLNPWFDKIIK